MAFFFSFRIHTHTHALCFVCRKFSVKILGCRKIGRRRNSRIRKLFGAEQILPPVNFSQIWIVYILHREPRHDAKHQPRETASNTRRRGRAAAWEWEKKRKINWKKNWNKMKRIEKAASNSSEINVSGPHWTIRPNYCRRTKKKHNTVYTVSIDWQTFARQFNSFWINFHRSNGAHSHNKHSRIELTQTNWHSIAIDFNWAIFF